MHHFYESIEKVTVILIDASNAFNSLNRQTALQNIHHLCPSLSKVPINTYREEIQLFVDRETLLSQEETTQGDPLAMAMYAITINPLMHRLEDEETKQVWFADDATVGGSLAGFKTWWNIIMHKSPLPFPAGCIYICTPNLLYFRVSSYLLCILPRVLLLSSASTSFALHALQH